MWISMFNYEVSKIQIANLEDKYNDEKGKVDVNKFFKDKHINPKTIDYMITEEEPEIYDFNLQTYLDIIL